jgi:hypothetical protein
MIILSLLCFTSTSNAIPISAMVQKSIQLHSAINDQIINSGLNLDISSVTTEINNAGQPSITYSVYLKINSSTGSFKPPSSG